MFVSGAKKRCQEMAVPGIIDLDDPATVGLSLDFLHVEAITTLEYAIRDIQFRHKSDRGVLYRTSELRSMPP